MTALLRPLLLLTLLVTLVVQPASQATAQVATSAPVPSAVQDARRAVVRIESEGTFRPAFVSESEESFGSGSGFVIDSYGTTVTNAHVVNRGGAIRAFFDGSIEPVDVTLLGIAECADLALLDLEGDGYPTLQWAPVEPKRGDSVFALGYPDSSFDTVVTRGTVRSVAADNPTEWASIERAIRHTAEVEPGNSGGPLLNEAGLVVGVTYAEAIVANRGYAIAAGDALALLDSLAAGEWVASIGASGEAFYEDAELNGLWVSSVQRGSPADLAGILPGDLIFALDGRPMQTPGQLQSEMLSRTPGEVVLVDVLRTNATHRFQVRTRDWPQ